MIVVEKKEKKNEHDGLLAEDVREGKQGSIHQHGTVI